MKKIQEENMQLKGTLNNERACSVFADEASTALGQLL